MFSTFIVLSQFTQPIYSRNVAKNDGRDKEQTRLYPTTNRSVAVVTVVAHVYLRLANGELRHVILAAAVGDDFIIGRVGIQRI